MPQHRSARTSFPTLAMAILLTGSSAAWAQEAKSLETMVVTAAGHAQDIKEAPASISVVTREDLDRAAASSLAEVLGTLPGVTGGYTDAGAGSKIAFRGMPDKYTLILVDGKRIGSSALLGHRPDTLKQDLNWLSPEDIERIEVVRGAMSTLYGSEAMGGVINIITKKVADKWGGSVSSNLSSTGTGGRGDTIQSSFSVSGPIAEGLGLRVGGSYLNRAADEVSNGSSGSRDDNLNAKLTWQANANHLFTLDASRGRSRALDFPNAGNRPADATAEIFGAGTMLHENFGVGHTGKFGKVNTQLDLYVNTFKNESGDNSAFSGAQAKETVLDFKLDTPVKFGVDQVITTGFQYKAEEVQNPSNIGNISTFILEAGGKPVPVEKKPTGWAASVFIEDQLLLREDLTLTLGVRGDKSDGYGLNLSPRAYAVYHATEDWTVRGGVSRGYRAPNLKERALSSGTTSMGMGCSSLAPLGYSSGTCVMVGNPDLKPEVSNNYELGLGYDRNGYEFGVTYFRSDVKNMMQNGVFGRFDGVWYTQQYNIEAGETEGVEASFALPVSKSLKLSGNLTHMIEARNKTTNARLSMTPEWTANAALKWQNSDKLATFVSYQYVGKQLYAPATATGTNNFAHANYTFDIGANYNVNKNLMLRAGIQNLTNNIAKTDDDYGDGSGRTFYVGLTGRF